MKRFVLISFVFLLIVMTPYNSSAEPIYGEDPVEKRPSLVVRKYISSTQIVIGDSITVNVNITNVSNQFAYNLTIEEPRFTPASVSTDANYDNYNYVVLGYGASVSYSYVLTPRVTGQFSLESTYIEFYDENSTLFRARSSDIVFDVLSEPPSDETQEIWELLGWGSIALVAFPIAILIANRIWSKR